MRRVRWRGAMFLFVLAIMMCACLAAMLSYLGPAWWPLDMLAQFRAQWMWLSCLCVALVLVMARGRKRLLCLVGVAGIAAALFSLWPCMHWPENPTDAPSITIAHINVGAPVRKPEELMQVIAQSAADIVFLQEVRPELIPSVEQLDAYKAVLLHPRPDTRGVAVLARTDREAEASLIYPAENVTKRPTPVVRLNLAEVEITIVNASLGRPGSADKDRQQRAVLADLAELAKKEQAASRRVIVLGDFNCAPWSSPPQVLVDAAKLRPAPLGPLLHGTWPSCLPWPFRVPIDHAFVDSRLRVTRLDRLPTFGSDHLGILVSVEHDPH